MRKGACLLPGIGLTCSDQDISSGLQILVLLLFPVGVMGVSVFAAGVPWISSESLKLTVFVADSEGLNEDLFSTVE